MKGVFLAGAVRGAKRMQALLGLPITGEEQGNLGL